MLDKENKKLCIFTRYKKSIYCIIWFQLYYCDFNNILICRYTPRRELYIFIIQYFGLLAHLLFQLRNLLVILVVLSCAKINILLAAWRQRQKRIRSNGSLKILYLSISHSMRIFCGLNCHWICFYISQDLASWSNLFQLPNIAAINANNFAMKAPKIHSTQKNKWLKVRRASNQMMMIIVVFLG